MAEGEVLESDIDPFAGLYVIIAGLMKVSFAGEQSSILFCIFLFAPYQWSWNGVILA